MLVGGFLLMTGSFETGLSWAMIHGMFFTIVAVPLLSLILKLWSIWKRSRAAGRRA